MIGFSWMLVYVVLAHVVSGCCISRVDDWLLVFRGVKGNKQDVFAAWGKKSPLTCTSDAGCIPEGFNLDNWRDNGKHLRSPLIDKWTSLSIHKIRVQFGGPGRSLEFDGSGSNNTNWFSKDRLLHSSWSDLKRDSHTNFFSMRGHAKRHFFINRNYEGCPKSSGWFVVIDKTDVCSWAQKGDFPLFMYSKGSTATNWNNHPGFADIMNVYIQTV